MSHVVTRRGTQAVRLDMSVSLAAEPAHAVAGPTSWLHRRSPWWLLLAGPVAGLVLGAVSRLWMRLISDDPEFSWSGTLMIVIAFGVAGLGHSIAWSMRAAGWRRRGSVARVVGAVLTLPLFVGAGAVMLPTVVGGSLGRWRTDWPRWTRLIAALIAFASPTFVIVGTLREHATARTATGLVLFLATYAAVVASMRSVVAPVPGAKRMRRAMRIVAVAGAVLLLLAVASFAVGLATAGL